MTPTLDLFRNAPLSIFLSPSSIEQVRVRLEQAGPARLSDGTVGYFVRFPREDDCFAAALATTLQIPIDQVPDGRIDERRAKGWSVERVDRAMSRQLDAWLRCRGLRMVIHRNVPARRRRWIGVVYEPGPFMSHCIVMSYDRFLFDPVAFRDHVRNPGSLPRVRDCRPQDITYGVSFSKAPILTPIPQGA
jgi:hypothetical protein